MSSKGKLPMWRLLAIVFCSVILITSFVIMGLIGDANKPMYEVEPWYSNNCNIGNLREFKSLKEIPDSERRAFYDANEDVLNSYGGTVNDREKNAEILYNNKLFVDIFGIDKFDSMNDGSIDSYYKRLDLLQSIVIIDNQYWSKVSNVDTIVDGYDFGKFIHAYKYSKDELNHYAGEQSLLMVYDIKPSLKKLNIGSEPFYSNLCKSLLQKGAYWKLLKHTGSFFELSSNSKYSLADSKDEYVLNKFILVLTNERVYYFSFVKDKMRAIDDNTLASFDKACISMIKAFDFDSYHKWENNNKKKVVDKNTVVKELRTLYLIEIITILAIFLLSLNGMGNKNIIARRWSVYCILCLMLSCIAMSILAIRKPNLGETLGFMLLGLIPTTIFDTFLVSLLCNRTKKEYFKWFLIPNKLLSKFESCSELKRRTLMLFICYPVYVFLPLPGVNLYAIMFYFLPVLIICL